MILMTIEANLFLSFPAARTEEGAIETGNGILWGLHWCSIFLRKNKHMLCYNRVHRRPRKRVRVRRPFEASDSRAPVVYTSFKVHV